MKVEQDGVEFMLRPPLHVSRESAETAFESLNPGDPITFDGQLEGELSLTMSGALRAPVLSVTLLRFEAR
jgi:hypothetical protein